MWVAACLQTANALRHQLMKSRSWGTRGTTAGVYWAAEAVASFLFTLGRTDIMGGLSITDLAEQFGISLSSYCQ